MGTRTSAAAIGLGSNAGDRLAMLSAAARGLKRLGVEFARSPVYETAPLGPPQPDYLNAVILLAVESGAEAILDGLLEIEASLGRIRRERWGPRSIDLDLLIWGDAQIDTGRLTVPLPGIAGRAFVLRPWADVAPDMLVPGLGTVSELLQRLPAEDLQGVRLFSVDW